MANKETQDFINQFILKNEAAIAEKAKDNPTFYNAFIDTINVISEKFGTGKSMEKVVVKEEPAEADGVIIDDVNGNRINFKVGDRFNAEGDKGKKIRTVYKIDKIDIPNDNVAISWISKSDGSLKTKDDYKLSDVIKSFQRSIWVKIPEATSTKQLFDKEGNPLNFQLGDTFILSDKVKTATQGDVTYTISKINKLNIIKEVEVQFDNNGTDTTVGYSLLEVAMNFDDGSWIKTGGLGFKEGDMFTDKAFSEPVYVISMIDISDDAVFVEWDANDGKGMQQMRYSISGVKEEFKKGNWVMVDVKGNTPSLSFSVNDLFTVKGDDKNVFKITIIDIDKNLIVTEPTKTSVGLFQKFAIDQAVDNFKSGRWVNVFKAALNKSETKVLPFKVGDEFIVKNRSNSDTFYMITKIDFDKGDITEQIFNSGNSTPDGTEYTARIDDAVEFFKNGDWILRPKKNTQALPFKVGDEYILRHRVLDDKTYYKIAEIDTNTNTVAMAIYDSQVKGVKNGTYSYASIPMAIDNFKLGKWILTPPVNVDYKVGDKIFTKNGDIVYDVMSIDDTAVKLSVKLRKPSDKADTSFLIATVENQLKSGSWAIIPFKEGDKFKDVSDDTTIYTITKVNWDAKKMILEWYSPSLKKNTDTTESVEDAVEFFKRGKWFKVNQPTTALNFKVGDQFETTLQKKRKQSPYKIASIEKFKTGAEGFGGGSVTVEWFDADNSFHTLNYTIENVNENIADGSWKLIAPSKSDFPLGLGSVNNWVVSLQGSLGLPQDGVFGDSTLKALQKQTKLSAIVDEAEFNNVINSLDAAAKKPEPNNVSDASLLGKKFVKTNQEDRIIEITTFNTGDNKYKWESGGIKKWITADNLKRNLSDGTWREVDSTAKDLSFNIHQNFTVESLPNTAFEITRIDRLGNEVEIEYTDETGNTIIKNDFTINAAAENFANGNWKKISLTEAIKLDEEAKARLLSTVTDTSTPEPERIKPEEAQSIAIDSLSDTEIQAAIDSLEEEILPIKELSEMGDDEATAELKKLKAQLRQLKKQLKTNKNS